MRERQRDSAERRAGEEEHTENRGHGPRLLELVSGDPYGRLCLAHGETVNIGQRRQLGIRSFLRIPATYLELGRCRLVSAASRPAPPKRRATLTGL